MTRHKNRSGRHCTRDTAAAQLGPVHAASSGKAAAAGGEAAPVEGVQDPGNELGNEQKQYAPLADPQSPQLSADPEQESEGGVARHGSEQGSEDYCSPAESSSTGTVFDASSKRSWIDGSENSPEQKTSAEEALRELSASPDQLTLAASDASQPCSPDGAAAHTAHAADAAVAISGSADCKERYTSRELRSYRSALPPSPDLASGLQHSGVPCQSLNSARSFQLPREAADLLRGQSSASGTEQPPASSAQPHVQPAQPAQQKRKVWKWVPWNAAQTSTQPAGENLAHAPSQQKAWGAAAQEAQQQDPWAIWRQEFMQQSAVGHSSIAGVALKRAGLLQQHRTPVPKGSLAYPGESDSGKRPGQGGSGDSKGQELPVKRMSQERPPATPKAAAASLLSAAQREQRHAALAVTLQDAEADLCPGILLQQATGAQWQLGAASAIALLNAEAGLCPDTQQQRWHCAPAAAAPLGAEAGLCMAMLLKQGTILQLQPGAPPPAQAPQLGTVQRIALQTLQRLAAQGNASPVQESGSAAMLQVLRAQQITPGDAQPEPVLYCGVCRSLLASPYSLPCCGHAFCGICMANHLARHLTCPGCRRDMSGPPERVHDLDDILNEKQSRLSQDEHQGYWERKSAFSSKQADAEASWNALFTQSEAANESQQQTPQRSSPRMRQPPRQQGPDQPARSTDTLVRSTYGTPAPARQLAGAGRAPAQRPPPAAFSTVWVPGCVHYMPAAMPRQPRVAFPACAHAQQWLQPPRAPPMPIYRGNLAPMPPSRLLPFPPPRQSAVIYPVVPVGLSRWMPTMYVPPLTW